MVLKEGGGFFQKKKPNGRSREIGVGLYELTTHENINQSISHPSIRQFVIHQFVQKQ